MELVKFNAKRTFANGKNIYQKGKGPYKAEKEKVELWEKSGHCQIIENDDINPEDLKENEYIDLDNADYTTLKELAKKAGIKGYNTMKADVLRETLKGE